jgi:hypothetical protein
VSDFLQRERASLKGRWTPLLVLITCCAVTLLVAQQGETIDRQRTLIQVLWGDSRELNVMKQQASGRQAHPTPPPPELAPAPPADKNPPAAKPKAHKAKPPQKSPERQAIERPGPRQLKYI